MSKSDIKPLKWKPIPGVGYTVKRRPDGGMHLTFSDLTPATINHWREFGLAHLLDSDRLTTNLYDLRQIAEIPREAIDAAIELNTDPSVRNIRLAVVVSGQDVVDAMRQIDALSAGSGARMAIFTDIEEAQAWLDRPLTTLV
jgi:hypothetical protein